MLVGIFEPKGKTSFLKKQEGMPNNFFFGETAQ
jgi:hypothetical protein